MKAGWWDAPLALQDLAEAIQTANQSPILELNQVHTPDEISAGPK